MNRGIEIIWGVDGRFLFGLAEVLRGSTDVAVWIFFFPVSHILVSMLPVFTMSVRQTRITMASYLNFLNIWAISLWTPRCTATSGIAGRIKTIVWMMMNIFRTISTRPGSIFVIPGAEIIIADTLWNYRTNLGRGAGLIGRITTILVIGKTWDLIANG